MNQIPNLISLLRLPLMAAFLQNNSMLRLSAVMLAGFTDFLDGYIARRFSWNSRLGTWIDPITDKCFVGLALYVYFNEGALSLLGLFCMLSRDIALLIFFFYLIIAGKIKSWKVQAFASGKIATTLQLMILLLLTLNVEIPYYLYFIMAGFGISSLIELLTLSKIMPDPY